MSHNRNLSTTASTTDDQQQEEANTTFTRALLPVDQFHQALEKAQQVEIKSDQVRYAWDEFERMIEPNGAIQQEYAAENSRLEIYHKHQEFILNATTLSFAELSRRISTDPDALVSLLGALSEPAPRFAKRTALKGLPTISYPVLSTDAERPEGQPASNNLISLFDAILINEKLTAENKFELLTNCLYSKCGFRQYAISLFQKPTVERIPASANKDELPWVVKTYQKWIDISTENPHERYIWIKVIEAGHKHCSDFFSALLSQKTSAKRLIAFIETWRNLTIDMSQTDQVFGFYLAILKRWHRNNAEFANELKLSLLALTKNNMTIVRDLYQAAGINNAIDEFLNEWKGDVTELNFPVYKEYYFNKIKKYPVPNFIDSELKILTSRQDDSAKELFQSLDKTVHPNIKLIFLENWVANTPNLAACSPDIMSYYIDNFELKPICAITERDQHIWNKLLDANPGYGTQLYEVLVKHNSHIINFFALTLAWLHSIHRVDGAYALYKYTIKPLMMKRLLSSDPPVKVRDYIEDFKIISQVRALECAIENPQTAISEKQESWLTSRYCFFATHSPATVYAQIKKQDIDKAKIELQQLKTSVTAKIQHKPARETFKFE